MNQKDKLALIEDALDVEEETLKPQTVLDNVEEYDSMAKLALIIMFEDVCGKKINSDIVRRFKTVGDILEAMD